MKRYDIILALGLLAFLGISVAGSAADEAAADDNPFGFYFDKIQSRYFFDGKKTFSVDRGALDRNKARVEVSIDDESFVPFSGPVDFRNEGRHTLKYQVVNAYRQVLFQKEFTFYLDISAPQTTVQKPAYVRDVNGVYFFTDSKGVSLSTYDGLSGVRSLEVSLDQKNFTLYGPSENFLEAGKRTVFFRATDNVGNVEPLRSFSYVLSPVAPKTILKVEPAPVEREKETYIGVGSLISFSSENSLVPVREIAVSVDGDRFIYSKPFRVGTPGPHLIKFYATDYAGNVEQEGSFRFSTDDLAPKTIAAVQGRMVDYGNVKFVGKDFQLTLTPSDSESGVAAVQYRLDSSSDRWLAYTAAIKLDKDGPHSIWFRSVDKVGNREEVQKISVIADMTPPKSNLVSAIAFTRVDNKLYSTFPNVLMFKGEDNVGGLDGVYVSVNDGPVQLATGGIPLENAVENKITYKAIDRLGNEEQPHTVVIHMSKPEVNVKLVAQSRAVGEEVGRGRKAEKSSSMKRSIASEKKAD